MIDPLENSLFDIPDYENTEDEAFPPLPPPLSPGREDAEDGDNAGEVSRLEEAPVAKRRVVKRPQPKLDSQRLVSQRGLPALRTLFDNVRFKGKGHEAEDLKTLIQRMENWAHRLYPKLQFDDFVDKLESLGSKKEVQTCLKRIRLDMPITHEDFGSKEDVEEDGGSGRENHVPENLDPFVGSSRDEVWAAVTAPSSSPAPGELTEEQRRRMELNKQRALERRLTRLQHSSQDASQSQPLSKSPADAPGRLSGPPGDRAALHNGDLDSESPELDTAMSNHVDTDHPPTLTDPPQAELLGDSPSSPHQAGVTSEQNSNDREDGSD